MTYTQETPELPPRPGCLTAYALYMGVVGLGAFSVIVLPAIASAASIPVLIIGLFPAVILIASVYGAWNQLVWARPLIIMVTLADITGDFYTLTHGAVDPKILFRELAGIVIGIIIIVWCASNPQYFYNFPSKRAELLGKIRPATFYSFMMAYLTVSIAIQPFDDVADYFPFAQALETAAILVLTAANFITFYGLRKLAKWSGYMLFITQIVQVGIDLISIANFWGNDASISYVTFAALRITIGSYLIYWIAIEENYLQWLWQGSRPDESSG